VHLLFLSQRLLLYTLLLSITLKAAKLFPYDACLSVEQEGIFLSESKRKLSSFSRGGFTLAVG
jgi:hypothetical protein